MAYTISDKCTACGKCESVCPVEAISKGEKKYAIDAETCVNCGQCVDECTSEAIAKIDPHDGIPCTARDDPLPG